jgi:hypothetical protein
MEVNITLESFKDPEFTKRNMVEDLYSVCVGSKRGASARVREVLEEMAKIREALLFKMEDLEKADHKQGRTGAYEQKEEIEEGLNGILEEKLSQGGQHLLHAMEEVKEAEKRVRFVEMFERLKKREEVIKMIEGEDLEMRSLLGEFMLSLVLAGVQTPEMREYLELLERTVSADMRRALEKGDAEEGKSAAQILCKMGKRSAAISIFVESAECILEGGDELLSFNEAENPRKAEGAIASVGMELDSIFLEMHEKLEKVNDLSRSIFLEENGVHEHVEALSLAVNCLIKKRTRPLACKIGRILNPESFLRITDLLYQRTALFAESAVLLVPGIKVSPFLDELVTGCPGKEIELGMEAVKILLETPCTLGRESINTPEEALFMGLKLANDSINRSRRMKYALEEMESVYSSLFAGHMALIERVPPTPALFEEINRITTMFLSVRRFYSDPIGCERDSELGRAALRSFEEVLAKKVERKMERIMEKIREEFSAGMDEMSSSKISRSLDMFIGSARNKMHGGNQEVVCRNIVKILFDSLYVDLCAPADRTRAKKNLDFAKAVKRTASDLSLPLGNFNLLVALSEFFLAEEDDLDELLFRSELSVLPEKSVQALRTARKRMG